MKTNLLMKVALFVGLAAFGASFSASAKEAAEATEGFKLIHVAELESAISKDATAVHIYDANSEKTRKTEGLIPGAVPLASSTKYDTKAVLPTDKEAALVFYCANTACSASHSAAKRAVSAGYKNVSVMADGIQGWKKAGYKTQAM